MTVIRGVWNNIQMSDYSDMSNIQIDMSDMVESDKFEARFLLKLREKNLGVALSILAYCENLFDKERVDRLFAKLVEAECLLFP